MMIGKTDHKSKAIEELMAYLDKKDGDELGIAMKPKVEPVEVDEAAELSGEMDPAEGAESPAMEAGDEEPGSKMSDEEMAELIEAIQSKLGAS